MFEIADTSTSLDNGVKEDNVFSCAQNKAEHDAQQNIDHNEDKYYVENEVSGIKSKFIKRVLNCDEVAWNEVSYKHLSFNCLHVFIYSG